MGKYKAKAHQRVSDQMCMVGVLRHSLNDQAFQTIFGAPKYQIALCDSKDHNASASKEDSEAAMMGNLDAEAGDAPGVYVGNHTERPGAEVAIISPGDNMYFCCANHTQWVKAIKHQMEGHLGSLRKGVLNRDESPLLQRKLIKAALTRKARAVDYARRIIRDKKANDSPYRIRTESGDDNDRLFTAPEVGEPFVGDDTTRKAPVSLHDLLSLDPSKLPEMSPEEIESDSFYDEDFY